MQAVYHYQVSTTHSLVVNTIEWLHFIFGYQVINESGTHCSIPAVVWHFSTAGTTKTTTDDCQRVEIVLFGNT